MLVIESLDQPCTNGRDCGDWNGDNRVDNEDLRRALARVGLDRDSTSFQAWRRSISTFISQELRPALAAKPAVDQRRTQERLQKLPSANVEPLLRVLARFGQPCGSGERCGDLNGDEHVDESDLRAALADIGYDRERYDTRDWARTISRFYSREIGPLLGAEHNPRDAQQRIRALASEDVQQVIAVLANYGRECDNPDCGDLTGNGTVTSFDLRAALLEAGIDRSRLLDSEWRRTATRFFTQELAPAIRADNTIDAARARRLLLQLAP